MRAGGIRRTGKDSEEALVVFAGEVAAALGYDEELWGRLVVV